MKKFMKWMPISMMIFGCMFMFAACGDDNEPTTPEEPGTETPGAKVSILLSYENIEVEAAGGPADVTYTLKNAGTNPKISGTSDQDWITDIQAADGKVTMSVAANTETAERTAKVTLTYSDDEKNAASAELTVTQGAKAEEKFTITIPGECGSTWIPFEIQPKDQSAQYFLNIRPAEEMEGFVSDEALFNSDMSTYQQLADQYGMSLNDVLIATNALVSGPLEDYLFPKLSPSTEYCIYCYGVENGKLVAPVSKVNAATTAAGPVDNKLSIEMVSKVAASVIFNVNVTTFDAYAMNIFDGSASDAEIENALMGDGAQIYAGPLENMPVSSKLEVGKEYAIAAIGRAGNTATTGLVVERFTVERGQVITDLTMDLTSLAFDGDKLAEHLGEPSIAGYPILFNNIETNGIYTATYPFAKGELSELKAMFDSMYPGESEETFYMFIFSQVADYCSYNKQSLWMMNGQGSYEVLCMATDEAQENYKFGISAIDVVESNYSPVEEIDKYLPSSSSKVLLKNAGKFSMSEYASKMKEYMDSKSTYSFKTSIKDMSKIRSMKE